MTQTEEGLREDSGFLVSDFYAHTFLSHAAAISYEDCFSDNADEWMGRLADFGLDPPRVKVTVAYTDGEQITFSVGNRTTGTGAAYYYMAAEGYPGLYAIPAGTAEDWQTGRDALHPVQQPDFQASRIDGISMTDASGEVRAWQLTGQITDEDASDTWVVTSPVSYPADGTAMISMVNAVSNIHMGTYVGEAETVLAQLGFSEPETRLHVHMAYGVGTVSEGEAVSTKVFPEESIELLVWGNKNENVMYVQYGPSVYLTSALTLGPVVRKNVFDTISRYPVVVGISALKRLTMKDLSTGEETVYELVRTEGKDEPLCLENGAEIPYSTFESRYLQMELCTVSGRIDGTFTETEAHTYYSFETVDGRTHEIWLYPYDKLHDAVRLDDYPVLFYLIHDGLGMVP